MEIVNFEQLKLKCELLFLEDILIEEEEEIPKFVNLIKPKLNQSSKYLFPSLKLEKVTKDFKVLTDLGFINLYSYYKELPIEYCIHLVFNPAKSRLLEFEELLDKFRSLSTFVNLTKLDDNVYCISLMMYEEFRYVFYPFINGSYRKMGVKYASLFPYTQVSSDTKVYSKYFHVITHSEYLQNKMEVDLGIKEGTLDELELDSKIELEKEILNYNYIKNENKHNKGR